MKKKKLLAAVAAIVGFSLCFLGCAADNDDDPPETNLPSANPFAEKTFYGSQTIEGTEYDVCELRFTSETEVTLVQYGKAADGADKTESLTYTVSDGKASVTYNGKTITTSTITDGGTFTASLDGTDEKKCSFSTTQGRKYPGASTDPDTPPANPFAGNTFYGSQTVNEAKYDFCELKFTSETEVTLVQYGKAAGGADKTELLTYTVSGGTASVAYRTTTITTSVIADGTFTLSLDGTDAKTYSFSTEKRSRYIADGMYCSGWLKVENSIVTKCDTAAKGAIEIPKGVTSIGSHAFSDCSGLTSVTIPEGVASIGSSAFSGCSGLTSVTIPASVTSIGSHAFDGCSSLTSVTIPASVTSIGSHAFSDCSGLTSVTIPEGVSSIGYRTFYNCSGLTSVTIPAGVTSIESYAFQSCSGLTSVTIPEGVTSIGSYAFQNCSGLTSVTIPASVTSIGGGMFENCRNLATVNYAGTTTQWATVKKDYGSVATVTCSDGEADWDYTLTIDENGVLTECTGSVGGTVIIPEGVTSIGSEVFKGHSELKSVIIPTSVTSIGKYMFSGCSGLISVTIPEGVTSIGEYAFLSCSSLTSVTILDGVTSIESNAFEDCSGLTSVTIPASVTYIGYNAFYKSNLATVNYNGTTAQWATVSKGSNWSGPTKVVTCTNGTADYNYWLFINENGVLTSGTGSVDGTVIIPDGVTSIGSKAFKGLSELTSVTIPASVASIGDYAFENCSGLTSVTIPAGVTSIGSYAFSGCSGLTSVTIPAGATSIGSYAFSGCSGLISVTIPARVTSIGSHAFSDCSKLTTVEFKGTIAQWAEIEKGSSWSYRVPYSTKVTCSDGTADLNYTLTIDENGVLTKCTGSAEGTVIIPEGVTSIGYKVFYNNTSLTSVTIPESVTSIGEYAFCNCSGLTSVTIPASVTSIGSCAFQNCSGLTSVTIPAGVTSIGSYAFQICSGLTSVTIPAGVTSIGDSAFSGCSSLATVEFKGTIAQWAKIEKGSSWRKSILATTVTCSDGSVNL